jgi:hypothetical protein
MPIFRNEAGRNVGIVNTTSDSFRIHIDVPPPSINIPNENTYDIIVEFSPSSLGDHSAELRISTNTKVSEVFIPVQGIGVIEEMPPVEFMAYHIDSFNEFMEGQNTETLASMIRDEINLIECLCE